MNAMSTNNVALKANLKPLSNLWMFGIKRSILNDLNNRMDRMANTVFVAIECPINGLINDGRAIIMMIKSNRFHPSFQYAFHPLAEIFANASHMNRIVNIMSTCSVH